MKPIIQLNQPLINKIAAGEVVERPLSVVKELLENAIDAGASTITIEISEGGLSSIRVTDNGGGIPADQILLAFARHATSKITSIDDLFEVGTLGFRGEALSSISAVAQVEMITKTPGAMMGTRVEIHGGQLISRQEIGTVDGTTVVVSNLFYNTPARRKFLKKPPTEAGYIADCLQKLALGNPKLTIRFINNGQIAFQTRGRGDLKTAMLNVYGHEAAAKLIEVSAGMEALNLIGLIGKPEVARGNRQRQCFFINGRLIVSKLLTQAVEEATRTMLPGGKFPVYVLNLELPHEDVDVNVHPTKMDVRFANEDVVFRFIQGAVREALTESNLIPEARFAEKKEYTPLDQIQITDKELAVKTQPAPSAEKNPLFLAESRKDVQPVLEARPVGLSRNCIKPYALPESEMENTSPPHTITSSEKRDGEVLAINQGHTTSQQAPQEDTVKATPQPFFTDYHITGLIFSTYWLITQGESLYLIDQHAAHERVLYEEIMETASTGYVHAQPLIAPIPIRLTPMETAQLKENLPLFTRFGFEITDIDDNAPKLAAVPYLFKGPAYTSFFTDILDKLGEAGFSRGGVNANKTEAIAMAACKQAVKAGDNISEPEARALIEKMLSLENPFTCPHGRPTIIEITRKELEKRFKRT